MKTQCGVWKHGCNWNYSKDSYYAFIKRRGIVLGSDLFKWKSGDLIMITEGFKVRAIVMVKEKPKKITEDPKFRILFEEYKVPFENWVNYAEAEWYELPEEKAFEYRVQRGAAKVRKKDIEEKAIKLWNERSW